MNEKINGLLEVPINYPSGEDKETTDQTKEQFIRIFKDSVEPSIWEGYCMGLNVNPEVESIKIYVSGVTAEDDTETVIKEERITRVRR